LCTKLANRFGKERVFIDVDGIDPGADFVAVIDDALSKCVVLIVVIGNGWSNAADSTGVRRLDDPEDLVCQEIERALARHTLVIPILVDGASMPRAADLPESLRPLARLNGQEMSYARFGQDCLKLISTLERTLGTQSP
jgi:TIR domain